MYRLLFCVCGDNEQYIKSKVQWRNTKQEQGKHRRMLIFFVSDKTPVQDGLHVACCVLLHFVTCVKKLIFNIDEKDMYFHNFGEGGG